MFAMNSQLLNIMDVAIGWQNVLNAHMWIVFNCELCWLRCNAFLHVNIYKIYNATTTITPLIHCITWSTAFCSIHFHSFVKILLFLLFCIVVSLLSHLKPANSSLARIFYGWILCSCSMQPLLYVYVCCVCECVWVCVKSIAAE